MGISQKSTAMSSPIAIVRLEAEVNVDLVLAETAATLKRDKANVAGFIQREQDTGNSACCSDMYLEDIGSGARFRITQSLGAGSTGCRLDPNGLIEAVSHMSQQINSDVDLLILNRFGKGEIEGGGFRTVIEAAFTLGVPTLIAVREAHLDAWREFAGDDFATLPANKNDILTWCRRRGAEAKLLQTLG